MQIITFLAMSGFYPCPGSQGSSSGRGSGKSSAPNSAQRPAQGRRLHDLSTKDCSRQSWDETKVGIKAWETNPWSWRKALALRPSRGVWALLNCDQEQNRMGTGWEEQGWAGNGCHSVVTALWYQCSYRHCISLLELVFAVRTPAGSGYSGKKLCYSGDCFLVSQWKLPEFISFQSRWAACGLF